MGATERIGRKHCGGRGSTRAPFNRDPDAAKLPRYLGRPFSKLDACLIDTTPQATGRFSTTPDLQSGFDAPLCHRTPKPNRPSLNFEFLI